MKTFVVCYLIIGVAVSSDMSATQRQKGCGWGSYDAAMAVIAWPGIVVVDVFKPWNCKNALARDGSAL